MQRRDKEKTLDTLAPTEGEHEPVVGDHFQRLSLADDLLRGAEAIAEHLYGHPRHRRKVYHLAKTKRLPVFRLGSTLCARRSTLIAWIEDQEIKATEK